MNPVGRGNPGAWRRSDDRDGPMRESGKPTYPLCKTGTDFGKEQHMSGVRSTGWARARARSS